MKLSDVKKELKRRLRDGEKLVDCYFIENTQIVLAIKITRNHTAIKEAYRIYEYEDDPYDKVTFISVEGCL